MSNRNGVVSEAALNQAGAMAQIRPARALGRLERVTVGGVVLLVVVGITAVWITVAKATLGA